MGEASIMGRGLIKILVRSAPRFLNVKIREKIQILDIISQDLDYNNSDIINLFP